ncbi:hypothetical protein [Sporisorium scitamineum]|uniref:Uncharacterized protein n=1 Tax=Sporisorium scitamineum TaxID=49012 RepID=A0A0F7S5K3_9BASI|nr:hypothetical protein [Sporisorium scitamineum]
MSFIAHRSGGILAGFSAFFGSSLIAAQPRCSEQR